MDAPTDPQDLLAADAASSSRAELAELVLGLDRLRDEVQAAMREALAEFDARAAHTHDGSPDAAAWLAAHGGLSQRVARAEVATARRLRQMPQTRAAAISGDLCAAKAALLARARGDEPASVAAFAVDEQMLVAHAKALTVDHCARMLRHWRACVDQATAGNDAHRLREKRGLHLSQTFEGMWVLDGRLDPEAGAIVAQALRHTTEGLRRAEAATVQTDAAAMSTPAQRRADALVELVRRGTAKPETTTAAVPLVIVEIDLETLQRQGPGLAATDSGDHITPEAARRLACDAAISRLITNGPSMVLDAGRATRTINAAQRRALIRRDRGCAFPGCGRPHQWCHAHHIVHWSRGGATDLANLCLLCSHHHHLVHEGGFGLARAPNGQLRFTRPDQTTIEPPRQAA